MTADEFDRVPPWDLAAEQCTLGGMMLSASAAADVLEILASRDYYRPAHQLTYEVIAALAGRGEPTDAIAVAAELTRRGEISQAGGHPYLHTLIASVPTAANAGYYARIVAEKAALRRLIEAGTRIVQLGYSGDGEPGELHERARTCLEDAAAARAEDGPRSMAEVMVEVIGALESDAPRGLPTGLCDLDELTGGLAPGELVIVAARPGVGKSVVTAGFAKHAALKLGVPSLLVSLEMSAQEISLRLISSIARVPLQALVQRRLTQADWPKVLEAARQISGSPLVIDDTPGMTLAGIRSRLRAMARSAPAQQLVVDYLGLVEVPRAENRQQAVAGLSRGLKLIGREFGIPVVAAAQLNRRPEDRPDRRPQMSDLRDSGAQEQDADIVILLHREDAYDRESPRAGEIDLIVDKNRQGPRTTITAAFQGHYGRCVDMSRMDDEHWSASRFAEAS